MRYLWASCLLLAAGCAAAPERPITTAEFLAQQEGLPLAEAERRIRHQDQLHRLVAAAQHDPAWADLRIQHRPDYRVTLRFTDGRPRPELVQLVPPDLRPHIVFGTAPLSRIEADRLMGELSAALQPLGRDWNIMYDGDTGSFTVNVARKDQIEPASRLVPAHLRARTRVVVGPQIVVT